MTTRQASAAAQPTRSALARYGWPAGIATVLGLTVAGNVWMMAVAGSDPAFAVEPDYYRKAVTWDAHMAQARANAALGWSAQARLELAQPGAPGRIAVTLRDRVGSMIAGASVRVEAMHNARASRRLEVALGARAPGEYSAAIDADRPGEWEVRISAEAGAQRFTETLRLTVSRPPAAAPASP
ncbi:MAG: FixH family protein [Gemmatimonadaceae bacterium]|nr:FixH family protein [Gemmatimonadaceae bacterium]